MLPIEKPSGIIDLVDTAFWLFKKDFRFYLRILIAITSFFSLIVFVILSGEINTQRPPLVAFTWIILGETPPGSIQPLASILRDIAFFDGSLPWIIVSSAFAVQIMNNKILNQTQGRILKYTNIILLSILVSGLLVISRTARLSVLSDIMRLPVMLAPYIIILENKNIIESIRRSYTLASKNIPRSLVAFVSSIGIIRITTAAIFSGSILASNFIYQGDITTTALRIIIPLFTIAITILIYPIVHIFMVLFYYDLRIRYDGLDLR